MRPLLFTSLGSAVAVAAVWSAAGVLAMAGSVASGPSYAFPKPQFYAAERMQSRFPKSQGKGSRLALAVPFVADAGFSTGSIGPRHLAADGHADRFEAVLKKAELTPEKLAAAFGQPHPAKTHGATDKSSSPAPERFASTPAASADQPPVMLAYAPVPQASGAAWSALLVPSPEDDLASLPDSEGMLDGEDVEDPDYEEAMPEVPVPQSRPRDADPRASATAKPDQPTTEKPGGRTADEAQKQTDKRDKAKRQKLSYAKPVEPTERKRGGIGQALRSLLNGGPEAGDGVAVYDISAARVYMPDGSVLEAHSGIGKMADNPRYAHVKMNGPTPPHTYDLKMREKRFHGVEALRMLPVDGKNKHGRDGFLTHSYLLRGGRAESHGCVAFKDYDRFLRAFKQGKVKRLVVVPSGGRATMNVASNGKST